MTRATLTGLIVGIAGIIVQFIAAPELFGAVPPGAFVIAAFAVFVALGTRWWWSPAAAVVISLWVVFGGLLASQLVDNLSSGDPSLVTGNVVMVIGLLGAATTGSVAVAQNRGKSHAPIPTASRAGLICGAGMLLAAGGDVSQGYDGPGPLIFLAVGVVVLVVRRRWSAALGLVTAVVFLIGAFVTPDTLERFRAPADVTPFVGTVYQLLGFAIAAVAGLIALLGSSDVTKLRGEGAGPCRG